MQKSIKLFPCSRCKQDKPEDSFNRCGTGRQRYCKDCQKHYVDSNRGQINAITRARRARNRKSLGEKVAKLVDRTLGRGPHSVAAYGFCCACGSTKKLCVRHIDASISNSASENIMVFCAACSAKLPQNNGFPLSV